MTVTPDDLDTLVFADDAPNTAPEPASARVWKLLIVDDEPEIHDITRLTVGELRVDGHPLAILSVHSATAASRGAAEPPRHRGDPARTSSWSPRTPASSSCGG